MSSNISSVGNPSASGSNILSRRSVRGLLYFSYLCAGFQFVRFHLLLTTPYLNLATYLAGHERLPFQRRIFPMLVLNLLQRHPIPASYTQHHIGTFSTSAGIYLLLMNGVCFALASFFCLRLHRAIAPRGRYHALVYPIFLYTVAWCYVLLVTSNLNYPFDMPALAFFSAGLYFIYTRRYVPLLLIVLVGTANRETTLFLVVLFLLDALAPIETLRLAHLAQRLRTLPAKTWVRTLILALAYVSVRIALSRLYRGNDASEDFLRLRFNLHVLLSQDLPQVFGACGFLLPFVWLLRRRIPDPRLASYILVLPFYVLAMALYGALSETRIYGELCPLVAVACTCLLETGLSPLPLADPHDHGPPQANAASSSGTTS